MNKTLRVLVADDDADDIALLEEALRELNPLVEIIAAADGVEALKLLKDGAAPDVVFLDLNMPLKNGLECLRDIGHAQLIPNVPVVVYSTSQNLKDINAANTLGARFYMVKPGTYGALQKLLSHFFTLLDDPSGEPIQKRHFVLMESKVATFY